MKRVLLSSLLSLLLCVSVFAQEANVRSSSIVAIDGERYYVHTVIKGETLYGLSRLYEVDREDITKNNPATVEGLQQGQVLKIPVSGQQEQLSSRQMNRTFDVHNVNQGETLYSISRRYGISVNTLLADNEGLDPAHLSIGQKINIRKKSQGDASFRQIEEEMNEYRDAINSVSTDAKYHLVESGETIYGLSRQYGVSEDDIKAVNNLRDGLKAGAIVVIPVGGVPQQPQPGIADGRDSVGITMPDDYQNRPWGQPNISKEGLAVKDLSGKQSIKVAMLLPLKKDDEPRGNTSFLEFYQGTLLAMEDLKADGISANVSLYNTSRTHNEVRKIVESPDFADTDIIIGPVYEECLAPVIEYAEYNGAAVVSPLAVLESENSPLLYQMAPAMGDKYDKVKEMFSEGRHVIYINSSSPDEEMDREVKPLLPQGYREYTFTGDVRSAASAMQNLIDRRGDNVFVVSCTNELAVAQILASISSAQNNMVARSMMSGSVCVLGSARWGRFNKNVDRETYFKLKVCFVTRYHADRSNELIKRFDKRYIKAFGTVPSLYSYTGYDAVKLFVGAAAQHGSDFTRKLNSGGHVLLQMPYNFVQGLPGTSYINDQWALVCYNSDYTIVVK